MLVFNTVIDEFKFIILFYFIFAICLISSMLFFPLPSFALIIFITSFSSLLVC